MVDQSLAKTKVSVQTYLRSDAVQQRIEALLDKRAQQFTTSLMSVVNSNLLLQECKPQSILTAAIKAAAMDLPIDPNLGLSYIIPYRNGKTGEYEAQYQMGWRGFIQLAQRSRQYKLINVTDVRKGEHQGENRMTGEIEFEWVTDERERSQQPVIGYLAFFRLLSGFEKILYMTVDELKAHAKKYSQSYKKGYGLWVDDFDSMSKKTVIKLLISRWGPMSTEMQQAILSDQAAVEEDSFRYVDNDKTPEEGTEPSKEPRKKVKTEEEATPEAETVPKPSKEAEEPPKVKKSEAKEESKAAPMDDKKELEAIKESIHTATELLDLSDADLRKIYQEVSGTDSLDSMDKLGLETVYAYLEEIEEQQTETDEEVKQMTSENVQQIFPGAKDITPKK